VTAFFISFGTEEIGCFRVSIGSKNPMGQDMNQNQPPPNKQRDEYQVLFEQAPCYITVQDRSLRLLRYNREFAEKFSPETGAYCYQAYKGRSERCEECPVLKTFEDGKPHSSEETGLSRDGSKSYWLVRSAPVKNAAGEVVAAIEMSLDLTKMKSLQAEAEKSERKYQTIFNTIPNPVFVLKPSSLSILDCNTSIRDTYGYHRDELLRTSFLDLFQAEDRAVHASAIRPSNILNKVRHIRKDGQTIYVTIRVSTSEYAGKEVLLVTTSDITKELMAEQQLIQASKMATLGEMATGVAHELNQPLSVIKTASSFITKKVRKKELIQDDILETLAQEIDSHVDRASKIISHMREFGRKSDVERENVIVNEPIQKALEIFSQQLKLREIAVREDFAMDPPAILADPNRLEQVFINLLINARDAIEEKAAAAGRRSVPKEISLKTRVEDNGATVRIEVKDTGTGIPKNALDKIFEPFFTTKSVGRGTGLGLSISYGIVQDYGGRIHVETKTGEGSTFILQFPVADRS
jgi:histidine kinase